MSGTFRRFVGVALLALSAAGCTVDVDLRVAVAEDGSGVVTVRFDLDDEAVEALGGPLEERLRVADLVRSGWEVETDEDGDGASVVARKEFGSPAQLADTVEELSGGAGPFRDFRLERDRSRFSTSFDFAGSVDLTEGVGAAAVDPADEALVAELSDEGVDVHELRRHLRERLDGAFELAVVVELPGGASHNAPSVRAGSPVWRPAVGERVEMRASASALDTERLALVVGGGLLALVALGVWWAPRRRRAATSGGGGAREATGPRGDRP